VTSPVLVRQMPVDTGAAVRVRALQPGETQPLTQVFDGLGQRSRELRFLAPVNHLTAAALTHLASVDDHDHVALVAESLADGRALGIARFVRDATDRASADVAVAVVDAWQGRGVGALLASALADRARAAGIHRFTLMVRPDNVAVVRLAVGVAGALAGHIERVAVDREAMELVLVLDGQGSDELPEPSSFPRQRLPEA